MSQSPVKVGGIRLTDDLVFFLQQKWGRPYEFSSIHPDEVDGVRFHLDPNNIHRSIGFVRAGSREWFFEVDKTEEDWALMNLWQKVHGLRRTGVRGVIMLSLLAARELLAASCPWGRYAIRFSSPLETEPSIQVVPESFYGEQVWVPYNEIEELRVGGPGEVSSGPSLMGGGIGLQGLVVGMAFATIANAFLEAREVVTDISIVSHRGDAYFTTSSQLPDRLRHDLTPVFTALRQQTQTSTLPLSQELEALATMHQNGELTDEEFELAKRRLLG